MGGLVDKNKNEEIWAKLKEIALKDGIFSSEEQDLMGKIILDLDLYHKLLENALKDKFIDKNEKNLLFEGRMQILEKAYVKAREDITISSDEREILKEICKIIRVMEI